VSRQALKADVCAAIERNAGRIIASAEDLLRHPELGFREDRTANVVAHALSELGLSVQTGLAVTGVKADLACGGSGPSVAILGEMDALPVPGHPLADGQTGAAHACGHFAQVGMLLGAATALRQTDLSELAGRIVFMAVPAEENVDLEFRQTLRAAGRIEFTGGKQELIRLGAFDDVDMAMLTHASGGDMSHRIAYGGTTNGHLTKRAAFVGRAAHAGAAPHLGVNALKAATLALVAIDAHREMFRDEDNIRVHPIITRGGDVVNAVPAEVRLETHVRANNLVALRSAAARVDLALRGAALAIGARVQIQTEPGYLPLHSADGIDRLFHANAVELLGTTNVLHDEHRAATTDMGDLSHLMPVIQPRCGGGSGRTHSSDFQLHDYRAGLVDPTKLMCMTIIDLLIDEAAGARAVQAAYQPRLNKPEYLQLMRAFTSVEEFGTLHPA